MIEVFLLLQKLEIKYKTKNPSKINILLSSLYTESIMK